MAHLAVISNAFLIAFTSDFLPRLLYKYEYDWSLTGYVNFTLAVAPNNTLSQQCRYRGYRDDQGNHTLFFWRLLAIRLAFVIIFEHVVFGVCRLIDIVVPDIPQSLEIKIKRERYLAKQALADSDTMMKVAQGNDDDDDNDGPGDVNIFMHDADSHSGIIPPSPVYPTAESPSQPKSPQQPSPQPTAKSTMPAKDPDAFSSYDFGNLENSPPSSVKNHSSSSNTNTASSSTPNTVSSSSTTSNTVSSSSANTASSTTANAVSASVSSPPPSSSSSSSQSKSLPACSPFGNTKIPPPVPSRRSSRANKGRATVVNASGGTSLRNHHNTSVSGSANTHSTT
ncbi:hypothetical protein O3P69_003724 [Scylla paramamosain]|uniref:Anoctamin n=2 Tax=Scylla paramamosain TaxID=85552 RepID=A0AAW0UDV4_SCYPA